MGFWPAKDKDKLYKQWLEHSDLPPEAIPKKETSKEKPVRMEREEWPRGEEGAPRWEKQVPRREERVPGPERPGLFGGISQRMLILYILLGAAIILLCVGVVILVGQVF
jgi:hypothetical protein